MQRRNFLKAAGGVIFGLPFLEGLVGRSGYAEAVDHRFAIFIRQPSGVVQDMYWPKAIGALTSESLTGTSLLPLLPIASQVMVVNGFKHGFPNINCDHSFGGVQAFTGSKPIGNGQSVKASGESLDNRIARELSPGKEPLTLYAAGRRQSRGADMCSFRGSEDLRTGERSPFIAYRRLFGMASMGTEDPTILLRKSVNDYVRLELKELLASPLLSSEDKLRLEQHTSSVRDAEKAMGNFSAERIKELETLGSATTYNETMPDIIKMHMDIMVLAMASGAAKSGTLQILDIIGDTGYKWEGVILPDQHENSHSGGAAQRLVQAKYDSIHNELFKYLVDGLNSYKIEGKTLLDQGVVMMTSEVGDGQIHSHVKLPTVIAGSANGMLKQGVYLEIPEKTNNMLLNTLGAALGLKNGAGPLDNFGDPSLEKGIIPAMMKV